MDTESATRDAKDFRNLRTGRMQSVRFDAFQGHLQMKRGSRWRDRFLILHEHVVHIYKDDTRKVFKFSLDLREAQVRLIPASKNHR